jgi:long-chain acyl-CoA synthetase
VTVGVGLAPSDIVAETRAGEDEGRRVQSSYLHEWVYRHAERTPSAPAIATPAIRLSYAELADRARRLASDLARSGCAAGERVLIALPNRPATVVAALAVNTLGATAVEVNRDWTPAVLGDIARRIDVRRAFIAARDVRKWAEALDGHALSQLWVMAASAGAGEAVASGPTAARVLLEDGRLTQADLAPMPLAPRAELDAPAAVLYTSGSTGRPHGVVQTFRNIDANTRSIVEYLSLTADDRALLALPLYYCYGRSVLQTHLFAGGSVFLDDRFAFPQVVLEALAAEGCTGFAGVPQTFEILRKCTDPSGLSMPRLRYVTQAGGAMAQDTIDWTRRAFAPAQLFVMYGQTEATARLAYLPPERAADKPGSIGIPIPGVELAVVDAAGRPLPVGETGELVARGDNVTSGYLDEPEATAAILHDGWLWTGDLAARDADGFFYHRGRTKEILKIGGHRASPVEIEQVVAGHPDVHDAAVIGAADPVAGEVPIALVVMREGATAIEADLRRFCQERLPAYAVPRGFVAVPSLPRNEAGKLMRSELRDPRELPDLPRATSGPGLPVEHS